MSEISPTEPVAYLVLRREANGVLVPYVNGEKIMGNVDISVSINNNQQLVQLVFHSSYVQFETAKPKGLH